VFDGFARVATAAEVGEGEIVPFSIDGQAIAVARSAGQLYAFADQCTHQECPLSTGLLEGTEIECECHGAMFDLRTGAVTLPPAVEPLAVYPVQESGEEIYVSLPARATRGAAGGE
jgi:nitrite reductase/ring-hydroxylating ferredoxin subunit